jgi:hypothetical protein
VSFYFKRCVLVTIVLVSAVLASLAAGVLVAYMVCNLMFSLFHTHARQIARNTAPRTSVATTQILES